MSMQDYRTAEDFLIFHSAGIGLSRAPTRLSSNRFAGVKD
jgi:hypothetical protein